MADIEKVRNQFLSRLLEKARALENLLAEAENKCSDEFVKALIEDLEALKT